MAVAAFRHVRRLAPTALVALIVALVGASIPLARVTPHQSISNSVVQAAAIVLPFSFVGWLLAQRQPRNALGWIMLGVAFFFVLNDDASMYSVLDYDAHGGRLPLGPVSVIAQLSWSPAIILMGLAVLVFPDARLPLGRWRAVLWSFLIIAAFWMVGAVAIAVNAIVGHDVKVTNAGDLVAIEHPSGAWAWWGDVQNVFFPVLALSLLTSIARQIESCRRATGERRLQLKWLLAGATVFGVCGFLLVGLSNASSTWLSIFGYAAAVGLCALPVSIGVAISKYRLFDIDRIISRTLSYVIVTGLVVGIYVGLVALTTRATPISSPVGVAVSTLAAAALFTPIRRRVQRLVDRRFNRARYDADATVALFAAGLRDQIDLDRVQAELLDVVHRSMSPSQASIWVRRGSAAPW